jgi:hypothetical protein
VNRRALTRELEARLVDGLMLGRIVLALGDEEDFEANLLDDVQRLEKDAKWRQRTYAPGGFAQKHGGKGPVTAVLYPAYVRDNLTAVRAVVDTVLAAVGEELWDLQLILNEDGACQALHADSDSDRWRIVVNLAFTDKFGDPAKRWVQVTRGTGKATRVVWEAEQSNFSVYGMSDRVRCKDADDTVVFRHTGTDRQEGQTMSLVLTIKVRSRCAPVDIRGPAPTMAVLRRCCSVARPPTPRCAPRSKTPSVPCTTRPIWVRRVAPCPRRGTACVGQPGPTARGGVSGRVPLQLRRRLRLRC